MRTGAALLLLVLGLCGCKPAVEPRSKAIIGAVLIDGAGGPPLNNSIVLVSDGRIVAAGRHGEIPVSEDASKFDGSGRYLTPAPIDIYPRAVAPEEARAQIAKSGAAKPALLHVWTSAAPRAEFDSLMESARAAEVPIAGHPASQADAQLLVQDGASVLIGMLRDTENLDTAFVTRLRDLRVIYAPALSSIPEGAELETARRNTRRLFAAGVPLAVATTGGGVVHECELMVDAGVPPLDVIVAATQSGARALRQQDDRGTIQPNKRADLLVLAANPGEDIRNLSRVERRMVAGEWK